MNIPLNIDWQQILLHLLNFVILAGGLYLLLYKPVKTFMEKRQQYYQEQDAKAAKDAGRRGENSGRGPSAVEKCRRRRCGKARRRPEVGGRRHASGQLSDARTQAEQILADAHAAAQREHDKLLSDAQKELKDLAVTATEKLVLQSDGDAFDQFLDAAERGKSHA